MSMHPIKRATITNLQVKGLHLIALIMFSSVFLLSGCGGGETPISPATTEPAPQVSSPTAEATIEVPTNTPIPTSTPEPTPTFDITSVDDWGTTRLVFNLEERSFGEKTFQGIFQLDLDGETLSEISPAGTQLLDVSPDHLQLLISRESEISLLNLETGSVQKIADDYFFLSPSGAKWDHAANAIYFLAGNGTDNKLVRVNPENGERQEIATHATIAVLEALGDTIILEKGVCNPFGDCSFSEMQWIDGQGNEIISVEIEDEILLPCQRPADFVYAVKQDDGGLSLHIRPHDQAPETVFWTVFSEYADCSWSPDGNILAVIVIDRFWYSGSIQEYYFQLLLPGTYEILDRSYLTASLDHVTWSPDGRYALFSGTKTIEEKYQVEITLMELNSYQVKRYNQFGQLQSENYLTIPQLFWVP